MNVGNAVQALRAGWILKNPETWKNRTVAVNALTALLGVVLAIAREGFGYDLVVPDDVIAAAGLTVWGLFNAWSTVATSAKVGLHTKGGDRGVGGPPDSSGGPV